jgi:hypothetical protein
MALQHTGDRGWASARPSLCRRCPPCRGGLALSLPELAVRATKSLGVTSARPGYRLRSQSLGLPLRLHGGWVHGRRHLAIVAVQLSRPPVARGRPPPGFTCATGSAKGAASGRRPPLTAGCKAGGCMRCLRRRRSGLGDTKTPSGACWPPALAAPLTQLRNRTWIGVGGRIRRLPCLCHLCESASHVRCNSPAPHECQWQSNYTTGLPSTLS